MFFVRSNMLNTSLSSNSIPKYFFNKLVDITPEDIFSMGAKAVGIDLDNTSFYDSTYKPFPGVYEWLSSMKKAGIPVIIVSNTYEFRANRISKKLGGLPYIGNANKPDTKCFFEAAKQCGVDVSEFAMVGDQLFTDIQGANNAGAISVRVKYMTREILMGIRFRLVRRRERLYLEDKGLGDKV